jgi:hypothetical protein
LLVRGRGARGCWHLAVPVIPLSDTALPGRCPRRLPTPPRVVRRCLRSRCWRVCVAVWSARHSRVLSPRLRARCVDGYRFVGPGDELAQPSCRPPSQDVVDRPSVTGDPLSRPLLWRIPRRRCLHCSGYRDRLRSDDRPQCRATVSRPIGNLSSGTNSDCSPSVSPKTNRRAKSSVNAYRRPHCLLSQQ